MKPIGVGIVGCGVIAPTQTSCFQQSPELAQVRWCCDLNESRAAALAEKFTIGKQTTDYHELLAAADVDLISICTDHASHAEIACAALKAGKHVLCEKALSHSREGLDRMLAAGREHPELLFAGIFQHRHEPVTRALREMVADGLLGTMLSAGVRMRCWRSAEYYQADSWRGTWGSEGGSLLINQAIHYIDLLQWIMGGVSEVSGFYENRLHQGVIETEDTAAISLRFRSNALGTIEATSASHRPWDPVLILSGSEATIRMDNNVIVSLECRDEKLEAEIRARLEGPKTDDQHASKSYYGGGHAPQIRDVLEAIHEGRPPYVTAAAAAETVDLVLAAYEAQRTRSTVTLKPRL